MSFDGKIHLERTSYYKHEGTDNAVSSFRSVTGLTWESPSLLLGADLRATENRHGRCCKGKQIKNGEMQERIRISMRYRPAKRRYESLRPKREHIKR